MEKIVSGDRLFRELVVLAMRACQKAERLVPRTGPGRKPIIPDWVLATLITVAVAARRKKKSAQYRYCQAHAEEFAALGVSPLPSRSTYFDRYQRAWKVVQAAILCEGQLAVDQGWAVADCVATDKSLIASQGPPAHRRQGRPCRVAGADLQAGWGRSEYDGWVYGYGYEVVVSAGKQGVVWPLLGSVEPANRHESKMFREKLPDLPRQTKSVLADRAYDVDDLTEAIEWAPTGKRTGRRFVCPLIRRANTGKAPKKPWKRSRQRKLRQTHRQERSRYFNSPIGRRLYSRRMKTAEPFNAWLKERFELQHRVWHRGLHNNRTQILAAVFSYQLMLHINRLHRRHNGAIAWILDAL